MRDDARGTTAFTLVELLVVGAVLGILAALLFSALSRTTSKARRTTCLANIKQIDQGVMMYAGDHHDVLFPFVKSPDDPNREQPRNPNWGLSTLEWTAYVPLVGRYVGWKGDPSPQNKLFACPADAFHLEADSRRMGYWADESLHSRSNVNYSSYCFDAGNAVVQRPVRARFPDMFPGVLGSRLSSIRTPGRTLLLGEAPTWQAYSWHSPSRPRQCFSNNALDMLGFADGHASYVRIHYDDLHYPSELPRAVFAFDPPAGYDYQWSGN